MADSTTAFGPVFMQIPLGLWIAMAVPAFTFLGVWRSNANSRKNLRDQLKQDSEQRDIERKMSLRREVFLEAAAALSHVNSLVPRAIDLHYELRQLSNEFASDMAKLVKVQMVGSDDTVSAVMTYTNEIGAAFMEAVRLRTPIMLGKRIINAEPQASPRIMQLHRNQSAAQLVAAAKGINLLQRILDCWPQPNGGS